MESIKSSNKLNPSENIWKKYGPVLVVIIILIIMVEVYKRTYKPVLATTLVNSSTTTTSTAPISTINKNLGRYIILERIQSSHTEGNSMNIAEILALSPSGIELQAVNATTGDQYLDFAPDKLIDGNSNSFAHTNESLDKNKNWFKVDLGFDQEIGSIMVINRLDCCKARIAGTQIRVVNENGNNIYESGAISPDVSQDNVLIFTL